MQTFTAEVKQYLRPDGRVRMVTTELPLELKPFYDDMREHQCQLEAEVLTTGQVSITVTGPDADLDFSITENGPSLQPGLEAMLRRQAWKFQASN